MRGEASVRQEEADRDDDIGGGRRRVQSLSYGTAVQRLRTDLPRHSLHSALSGREVPSVEEELSERRRRVGLTSEPDDAKVLQTDAWKQVIIHFTSTQTGKDPMSSKQTTSECILCIGPVNKETIRLT